MSLEKIKPRHRELPTIPEGYHSIGVRGGHMNYQRFIAVWDDLSKMFIKHHDSTKFTDPVRERHSRLYLEREYAIYKHLASRGFESIPSTVDLISDTTLLLEPLDDREWFWRAPKDPLQLTRYIEDTLAALKKLSLVDAIEYGDIRPSQLTLHAEGWDNYPNNQLAIEYMLHQLGQTGRLLLIDIENVYREYLTAKEDLSNCMTHHDLRQSNIAWHPLHGTKIVDWSWAGAGVDGADATSFLIDLAKSGIDVSSYRQSFNPQHALTLIGFWLEHSTWPSSENPTVRQHQLASAITAHRLYRAVA